MSAAEEIAPEATDEEKIVCELSTEEVVDKCVIFAEALSGVGFYNYQKVFARRIIDSVLTRDGDVITALWSRQSGKTETVADVSIGLAVMLPTLANAFPDDERFKSFKKGVWIGIFAPILEQAVICYNRMREKVNSEGAGAILHDPEIGVQVTQNRGDTCAFSNGSIVRARSASEDSQIEGGTFHIVILEESQKMSRSKVNKEITPMLASTNGTMVKIGTAYMSKGGFHQSIQMNIDTFKVGGKRSHFEFPYDLVIKEKRLKYEQEKKESGVGNTFHLNYEAWMAKEIKRLGGTDSDEFKMNFRLIWHETRLAAVKSGIFKAASMDGQFGRPLKERGHIVPKDWVVIAGLDIGKSNDSSVLTLGAFDPTPIVENDGFMLRQPSEDDDTPGAEERHKMIVHNKMIVDWLEMQGAFEGNEGQYAQILEFLRRYPGLRAMGVDSTGMGDPVAERLQVLLPEVLIIPVRFNAGSKHMLYKYYLNELHAHRVLYPGGPIAQESNEYQKFQQEHMDLDKTLVQGYTVVKHSDEDGHDDYPDSAALMAWAEKNIGDIPTMPVIEEDGADTYRRLASGRSMRYSRGRR